MRRLIYGVGINNATVHDDMHVPKAELHARIAGGAAIAAIVPKTAPAAE
jgi:hypothetical protein